MEADSAFEQRFLENAKHFLYDLHAFNLEAELSALRQLRDGERTDTDPGSHEATPADVRRLLNAHGHAFQYAVVRRARERA